MTRAGGRPVPWDGVTACRPGGGAGAGHGARLGRLARAGPWLGAVAAAAVFLWIRAQRWLDDFPNPDVAGIAYEADRIREGAWPYLDVVEVKPPGAFFLAALAFDAFGRSIAALQMLHALLVAGAGGLLWAAARTLGGRRQGGACATVAVLVFAFYVPQFEWNYTAWMVPFWTVAAAALVLAREGRTIWWVLAGVSASVGFVCKQPAATIGLPAVVALAGARDRVRAAAGLGLGAVLGLSPWLVVYAAAGGVGELLDALVPMQTAAAYVGAASPPAGWPLRAARQAVEVFPGAVAVLAAALFGGPWGPRTGVRTPWFAIALFVAGVAGAAMGGARFYEHYLVQYVPGLAFWIGSPWTLGRLRVFVGVVRSPGVSAPRRIASVLLLAVGSATAAWEAGAVLAGRRDHHTALPRRLTDGRTAAQAAGAHIAARTTADDTIHAWGWTAWPVYFWADRAAPTPVYKPMGVLTTFNTNTAFAVGGGPRFRSGPQADAFAAAFTANPPAYFVYSPSMVRAFGAPEDPLFAFAALRSYLERHYVTEAVYGDLVLLRRRGPAGAVGGGGS